MGHVQAPEGEVDLTGIAQALAIIDDKNNSDPPVKLLRQMLGVAAYGN